MTRIDADFLRDPRLLRVISAIEAGGHRIYVVGGAVRNALLGRPVDDIDLSTDARPDRVEALAAAAGLRSVGTGIDHGTVTVIADDHPFEVTSFRRDVETDGRRAVVAFSDDLAEDAQRRDFTMNALYATVSGEVIDLVGGLQDLRAHRLRFVGQPQDRIREDYLRILRFFRFLAWYGREAEPQALAACAALASGLSQISHERIGAELRKLLAAPDPGVSVGLMDRAGVLAQILPDATADLLPALLAVETAQGAAPDWGRRLAALRASAPTEALRLSRTEARRQELLAQAFGSRSLAAIAYADHALAQDVALLRLADGAAVPGDWRAVIERAAQSPLPIAAGDLAGLRGPAIGRGLRAAERGWIESEFTLPRDHLVALALTAGQAGDLE